MPFPPFCLPFFSFGSVTSRHSLDVPKSPSLVLSLFPDIRTRQEKSKKECEDDNGYFAPLPIFFFFLPSLSTEVSLSTPFSPSFFLFFFSVCLLFSPSHLQQPQQQQRRQKERKRKRERERGHYLEGWCDIAQ